MLVGIALLLSSPGRGSRAQEPNRQLVHTGSTNTSADKRIALVIGNGAYTSAPPLKNPPNDARDMAATLKALGFDVTNGINVKQRDMKRLIREFGQKLKAGGSGLFYYAGHGVQSRGRNYLIPIDADIQSEAEVEDSGVDAGLVLHYMDDAQNGLNIVILDACRNNPFARSFRSAGEGLAQVDAPTGTLIAYATAPGRVASDGAGQNGLYTSELLKQMRVPGVSLTDVFMRVRAEVMKQTGSKQVPWEASSLVGSFFFAGSANSGGAGNESNQPAAVKIDPSAFELTYWETIKNSQNADDYKAYLEKYPAGQFTSLAKNRITSLQPESKPTERSSPGISGAQTELTFWDSVKNSTSADDYRAYLRKYPNGEFADLAKSRLKPLEAAQAEKEQQDELKRTTNAEYAKNHKVFKVRMNLVDFKGASQTAFPAIIAVAATDISVSGSDREGNRTGQPMVAPCASFKKAKVERDFIREIVIDGLKFRFQAESPAEATRIIEAIQGVCKGN